jgi:hypothetical protein
MVVVAVDGFGAMIVGGMMSAMVTGVAELAAARFSRWRRFFAAFFEIVVVSMVTKKGKVVFNACKRRDSEGRVRRLSID